MPFQVLSNPPPRVEVAMGFLRQLTMKQMPHCAVNDISIEWRDGEKLTTAEANAQATACHMLNDYFLGKWKLNHWEKIQSNAILNETEGNCHGPEFMGKIISCFACPQNSPPRRDCVFCKGEGSVLVMPTSVQED